MTQLYDFIKDRFERGGFSTEDALLSFLPLARQVVEAHVSGLVAPLGNIDKLRIDGTAICIDETTFHSPQSNWATLRELEAMAFSTFDVVGEEYHDVDTDDAKVERGSLRVAREGEESRRPAYMSGYACWEHQVGIHDPLTDVFSLGMILASLTCGLDFNDDLAVERFAEHQNNLFAIQPNLHPVLAMAISKMTHLDRHRRPQDLASLLQTLETYRDQDVELEFDLARIKGFNERPRKGKRQVILSRLQEYLFEISRRNRLLQFRQTQRTVNMTQCSVPLLFDIQNIRSDQILVWNSDLQKRLVRGKAFSLNKYLNFNEAIYLPGVLDRIRLEANRDRKEFGFAQLRLVACFLRWTNFKVEPPEQFESPLVLLPVELTKKKGVRDTFQLKCLDSEAEINPVIRHQFKNLYGIDIPETLELSKTNLDEFHAALSQAITASEAGVTLHKVSRPQIQLLHRRAKRRLHDYCRRRGIEPPEFEPPESTATDVSIENDNSPSIPLENPVEADQKLPEIEPPLDSTSSDQITESNEGEQGSDDAPEVTSDEGNSQPAYEETTTTERTFYQLRYGDDNPFNWEFDLCNVTVGNFKYRKMSLVRDYNALLAEDVENPAFDSTFSLVPGVTEAERLPQIPLEERFHVVACDPTQMNAIAKARAGDSFIIQGPPGTGKSQTITNLIADYIMQGKRVLFVCEKRAALDVVYARLKQQGLHELCCLIHDSQADKKLFVADLRETYEGFLAEAKRRKKAHKKRERLIESIQTELQPIDNFNRAMSDTDDDNDVPLRHTLERLIALKDRVPELSPLQTEQLPQYHDWAASRSAIERLQSIFADFGGEPIFAKHPLSRVHPSLVEQQRPLEHISVYLEDVKTALEALNELVERWKPLSTLVECFSDVEHILHYAGDVEFLSRRGLMILLDTEGPLSKELSDGMRRLDKLDDEVQRAQNKTKNWRDKLNAEDTESALLLARRFHDKLTRFVSPSWWKLRSTLQRCYAFDEHKVPPTWKHILSQLQKEHAAVASRQTAESELTFKLLSRNVDHVDFWGTDRSLTEFSDHYVNVLNSIDERPRAVKRLHATLLTNVQADDIINSVNDTRTTIQSLRSALDECLIDVASLPLDKLHSEIEKVTESLDSLPEFLNCVKELAAMSPALATAFRTLPLLVDELEAAIAEHTLETHYQTSRATRRYNASIRDAHLERLGNNMNEWMEANAETIRKSIRSRFNEHVKISGLPAAQLTSEQKDFKRVYNRGRRELQHEFGKSMRYKSIRDLVAGESGMVVQDLKPVWLMSPLSVSDTLPLDPEHVDVVIFDEASQITLEEAVPSLFRAKQAIVVGDEMQLPPTNFFSAKKEEEQDPLEFEEVEGELVQYDLECNSFLSHAAKNLPRRMLGWHYRSRSESLISFSNWAFYQGRLLTVPEERLPRPDLEELVINDPADGRQNVAAVIERPVSFHYLDQGCYEKRRNTEEAAYIAELVRGLILGESDYSIGVVAFSEAQQGEIESAIYQLAGKDREFARQLELEQEREVDGQFVGLLVKNLENIQGDERDIIILSVCYGHPSEGKMRMNFGPINKSGGEKRLNVAFSRAKQHMVVVSSIHAAEITNDCNDGARCLKGYLQYTAAMSAGNQQAAANVLRDLTMHREQTDEETSNEIVAKELAEALRANGFEVDFNVGQSHFRCDLGVRRDGEYEYAVGVILDSESYYDQADIIERELMRPRLLRAFGWKVVQVLAKDWYHDRDGVIASVLDAAE